MQVFKIYFKIIRACLTSLIIYIFVFLTIAVCTSFLYVPPVQTEFTESKAKIAIINRDRDSHIVDGLTAYLSQKNTIVKLPDNSDKLQDALFFREVEYILIIPMGFSDGYADDDTHIQTVIVPDSVSACYVDMQIDKYLGAMRLAQKHSGLVPDKQALLVADSIDTGIDVRLTGHVNTQSGNKFILYYDYVAYVMLAISTLGISTLMMVFNRKDLKMRNLCSPLRQHSINIQLALGSAVFAVGCWLFIIVCSILIYGRSLLSSGMLLPLSVNALAFTVVSTAIGFLVGILIKSHNVQAAVANVLSLGMSFLCGVFVPQQLLGKSVLRFSSFLPAYWFIRANNTIGNGLGFADAAVDIVIQLGFAVAIFSATLFISKHKSITE